MHCQVLKSTIILDSNTAFLAVCKRKQHRSASRTTITGNGTGTGPGIGAGAVGFWAGSGPAPTGRFWADRSGPVCAGLGRLVSIWAGWCRSRPDGVGLGRLVSVGETTSTGTERHRSEKAFFYFYNNVKKGYFVIIFLVICVIYKTYKL